MGLPATWSLLPSAGRVLRRAAARDGWISAPELREIARSGRAVADEVPPWQRKPLESDPNPNPHPNQVPPWHRKPLEWPREEAVDLALALEAAAGFGSLAQAPGYTYYGCTNYGCTYYGSTYDGCAYYGCYIYDGCAHYGYT